MQRLLALIVVRNTEYDLIVRRGEPPLDHLGDPLLGRIEDVMNNETYQSRVVGL
jgi:hypothetical protein